MNEQLQTERKSTLDFCPTTTTLSKLDPIDLEKIRPANVVLSQLDSAASPLGSFPRISVAVAPPQIDRNIDLIFATLELTELKVGNSLLKIEHSTERKNRQKPYYSTTITNRSTEKIRIDRFGTYIRKGNFIVLHSITGGYFSTQQFQEWYDLGGDGWLEPGHSVTDPNNHSNPGIYWAYTGTTASGRQFAAGTPWRGGKSWWQIW